MFHNTFIGKIKSWQLTFRYIVVRLLIIDYRVFVLHESFAFREGDKRLCVV